MQDIQPFGDNFIIVITTEDPPVHTKDMPFCCDRECPCHNDVDLISEVEKLVDDGLITPLQPELFIAGFIF